MPILLTMLLAGSAFGWEAVESSNETIARLHPRPQMPDVVAEGRRRMENHAPYVPTPSTPSSTSYSQIILPDGQTASVLTYH